MITLIANTSDVSASYERGTFRMTEQLNNRRRTCNFSTISQRIEEGTKLFIYDTMPLRKGSTAGTDTLYPISTYVFEEKFRAGDRIYIDINGANQRRYYIDHIDHAAGEVVLTQNLAANVTRATLCGKRIFGGISMNPSEEEVGNDNTFLYSHILQDWSAMIDLKNVAATFLDQYPREIYGRMLRQFVALDSRMTLDSFEAAWTAAGVARAMADETTDVIEGNKSQKTGATGMGTATWTKSITAADLSSYEHARFWWKMAAGIGSRVTGLKLRIGNDASNYNEYVLSHVGESYEDCWSYESAILAEPAAVTGTPDMETVDWLQIVLTASGSIPAGDILFDHMQVTTGGFTIENVERGISKFEQLPAAFIKPTELMEDVAKRQSMYQFIDTEKDIHLFATDGEEAPFDINTTDKNWGDLDIERDLETVRNRVAVRGAETISDTLRTQEKVVDGVETSFNLDYKPSGVKVYVAEWNGSSYDAYAQKTVGVENLDEEADFEFMMNFQEKFVRNATFPTLDGPDPDAGHPGDKIKITYYPYIPVIVQLVDSTSVDRMKTITGGDGIYDSPLIVDERIRTFTEARRRAQVELDLYSNAVVTCTFQTNKEGLHAGQIIHITDVDRDIDDDFILQQVRASTIGGEHDDVWSYSVTASSSLFGLIEFFQLLMRRSSQIPSDITEGVQLLYNIDDELQLADDYVETVKSRVFKTGDQINYQIEFGNMENIAVTATGKVGSNMRPSWYATFDGSETGEVGFDDGNYNTGKVLKLQAVTGGSGKSASMRTNRRRRVTGGAGYTVKAWIEILAALTNVGTGGGFRLRIAEYSSQFGATPLQTTTIFSGETSKRDFLLLEDTHTMHASATHVEIELSIYQAAGEVSVGEIHLIESTAEGQTNPAHAGFAETSP